MCYLKLGLGGGTRGNKSVGTLPLHNRISTKDGEGGYSLQVIDFLKEWADKSAVVP